MKTNLLKLSEERLVSMNSRKRTENGPKTDRQRTYNGASANSFGILRYAAILLCVLTLGVGQVWGTQTSLISGVTLPDIPSSVLNMETQEDFTPASNWIVFNPNLDAGSKSWMSKNSGNTGSVSVSAPSGCVAPFVNLSSKACYKVRQTERTYAIRFSKATDISFMVNPAGSRTIYVSLYEYDGSSKQDSITTKSQGTNAVTELYFDELDLTKEYVAYIYMNSSSDGYLYEIAVKRAGPGPYSVTYDKNGGTGTMTDASSPYVKNTTVTTLANTFTAPTGKTFTGWNTRADGTGTSYAAGATFTAVKDVKLYAQWAYPATGTGTITYTLTKASDAVSGVVTGVSTISGLASSFTKSNLTIGTNSQTGYCGNIGDIPAEESSTYYVDLPFTVASGYTFNPTAVSVNVNPLSGTSYMKVKVSILDNSLTVTSNELSCAKSTDNLVTFASGAFTDKLFTGTVHIRVYLYCSSSGKYAYIKSPVTITGTVAAAASGNTLSFDANGGTGTIADIVGTGSQTLPSSGFTNSGYTLAGWATSQDHANAGTVDYALGGSYTLSADATLYAVWQVQTPSITFSDNTDNEVTITCATSDVSIYYTTNGTTPTTGSTLYDGTFAIRSNKTIKAIAVKANYKTSEVASLSCTHHTASRVFKSGERIYFKDVTCTSTLSGAVWDAEGGNVYAYFWNDTENGWSTYGDKVEGTWHNAGAIYKIVVPGSGETFTKVLFTRGTSASWDGRWDGAQTNDQTPDIGQNLFIISDSKSDSKWDGSWSKYVEGAAVIGDFNEWNPDEGKLVDGRVIIDLPASESFEFKVLVGDGSVDANYWGLTSGNITNTTSSWWKFFTDNSNCSVTTGEAGEYCFHWNIDGEGDGWLGIYYPQARFAAQQYIYFNVEGETGWKSLGNKVMFWTKYYDSGDNNPAEGLSCTSPLETYVYYTQIPNNDYIGRVQLNMYDGSTWKASSLVSYAYSRTSSLQNCMIEEEGKESSTSEDWTPQWTTYCPPMSAASLSDNSTTVIAGTSGTGTSENPFLVPTAGTILVQAAATSAVADPNMTKMFDFKVGGSSAQAGTGTTFSKGSLSNNTTYTITVDAYNTYNETNGTKSTPDALYYKALDTYAIKYNAGTGDGITGSHDDDLKIYGIAKSLPGAVFTRPNYIQTGWATSDGGTKAYELSASYTGNDALNLYPVWTAKTTPTVYGLKGVPVGLCGEETATITLTGSQSGVSYQLKKDGTDTLSAKAGTGSALEWEGMPVGTYTIFTVETTNYKGGVQMNKTDSTSVTVTKLTTTAISTQPTTAVAGVAGEDFKLGTGMVAEGESLTYRWLTCKSDGTDTVFISGATSATYTTSASAGTYYYRVKVSGTCGAPVLSNVITVTVAATYTVTYSLNGGKYNGSSDAPTQSAVTSGTEITLPSLTPTKEGYVFASWKCSVGNTYHWESYSYTMTAANTTFTAQWVEAADLTSGTLYMVDDIKPLSVNAALSSTGQYAKGISSNGCFTTIGNPLRTDNSDGTFEFKTETKQTVDDIDFTNNMWFKGASNVSSYVPTSRGLKFSVANPGTLIVYCTRGDRINLSNGTTAAALTDNTSGSIKKREVEIAAAGTYYLYSTNSSNGIAGIKFVEKTCDDVDAPTGLTCSTAGVNSLAFSWTAASNASSYDVYLYSDEECTSPVTPTEGSPYNVSTTSATLTGLTASTTYYCKVQSKGDGEDYCTDGGMTDAEDAATTCTSITPTWSYPFSTIGVGITIFPTIGGNTGSGTVTYSSSNTTNITNALYANTASASATITANVAANGNYCSGSVTSSSISVVADQTGLIKQSLNYGNSTAWGTPSAPATSGTYASDITSTTAIAAYGTDYTIATTSNDGNNSNDGQTGKVPSLGSYDATKYVAISFTVASGKKLNVSAIYIPVQPVSKDYNNFKAVLTDDDDDTDDIVGTISGVKNGKLAYIPFSSYGSVTGNVTLKIYAWGNDGKGNDWTAGYRFGKSIVIDGETEDNGYVITKSASNGSISTKVGGKEVGAAFEEDEVTITATPSTGYSFTSLAVTKTAGGAEVALDADDDDDPTTRSFTMPGEAVTVNATFTAIDYKITHHWAKHGSYYIQVGTGSLTENNTTAHYGQTITLSTKSPSSTYKWGTWGVTMTESGEPVVMATDSTFLMPDGDVTIYPQYGTLYTVTFNGNGGRSVPSPKTQANAYASITMPAAPTSDSTFVGWVIGGTTYAVGASYTPTADVTAYAAWKEKCAGGGGSTTIVLSWFSTPNASNGGTPKRPDDLSRYCSGYTNSAKTAAYTYTMTSSTTQNQGATDSENEVYLAYNTGKFRIYADNTTTGGDAPATFTGVSAVAFRAKLYNKSSGTQTTTYKILVGTDTVASGSISGNTTDGYKNISASSFAGGAKNGYVEIITSSSGTSGNLYIDSIAITYGGSSGSCKYVTYHGNGATGSGITNDATAYTSGATVTVASNGFSYPGYTFTGWNTKANGSGSSITAGSSLTITQDTTLYAQWTPAVLTLTSGADWTDPANWSPACVPTINHDVVINTNATLYGPYAEDGKGHGVAKSVKINNGKKLSIWSEGSLIVAGGITAQHADAGAYEGTTKNDLRIESSVLGNGTLICGGASDNTAATYEFYTRTFRYGRYYINQYVGIPFEEMDGNQLPEFRIFIYADSTDSWVTPSSSTLEAFVAYDYIRAYSGSSWNEFDLNGTLNLPGITGDGRLKTLECGWRDKDADRWKGKTFPIPIDTIDGHQDFMFANSWTAPIDIASMTSDDFDDIVNTIYIFNAGFLGPEDSIKVVGDLAGQWSAFPIAGAGEMDNAVIPATQAFCVTATAANATLTLDYEKHVYNPAIAKGVNNFPTRAPRRERALDRPLKLRMKVLRGTDIADQIYLFEREDFTYGFDNGWDGNKAFGLSTSPQLYTINEAGRFAVGAVPEMEGTEVGFKAATDANLYTFSFEYPEDAEPLYLYDRETQEYTQITNEATYTFATEDTAEHARFVLTRSNAPWIATGFDSMDVKSPATGVQKVLINDHIYILRSGHVYSVDGMLVK